MSDYFDRHPFQLLLAAAVFIGALVVGVVYAVATDHPNFAGTGNAFDVTATVTGHTDSSVFVDQVTVNSAEGLATNWFTTQPSWWSNDDNHLEMQNNYNDDGFFQSRHYVGVVYDANNDVIPLTSLRPGTRVRVIGAIRASQDGKTTQNRAVYTAMTIVSQSSS